MNAIINFLSQNYLYIIIGIIALLLLIITFKVITKALAKGKLQALKPLIEQLIIQFEAYVQSEELEKQGVKKMADLVKEVKLAIAKTPMIGKWVNAYLTDDVITALCQEVYDSIQDTLPEKTKEFRDKYLK